MKLETVERYKVYVDTALSRPYAWYLQPVVNRRNREKVTAIGGEIKAPLDL